MYNVIAVWDGEEVRYWDRAPPPVEYTDHYFWCLKQLLQIISSKHYWISSQNKSCSRPSSLSLSSCQLHLEQLMARNVCCESSSDVSRLRQLFYALLCSASLLQDRPRAVINQTENAFPWTRRKYENSHSRQDRKKMLLLFCSVRFSGCKSESDLKFLCRAQAQWLRGRQSS